MTGEPLFPGEVTEKVSVAQSPTAPPLEAAGSPAGTAAATVPATGPPMSKLFTIKHEFDCPLA